MTRYSFVPDDSRLFIHASSSIHGISTDADGVEGELELTVKADGSIDVRNAVTGTLRFEITRLSSGNPLYDVETERRIEVKKYPHVEATLSSLELIGPVEDSTEGDGSAFRYAVEGDLTLHGTTQSLGGEIGFRVVDTRTVQIWGEQVIDVRAWGIKPPRLGLIKVHPDVRVRLEATARSNR